jgi:hypothetical protein
MTTSLNGYSFAELGPGESLQSPDTCDCCERTGLKKTVKLVSPAGRVVWFGTGCAARAMGCQPLVVRQARAAAEATAIEKARVERCRIWAAEDAVWGAFLAVAAPGHDGNRFKQIEALGGYSAARAAFLQQSST